MRCRASSNVVPCRWWCDLGRYVIPWSSDGMADELAGLVGRKMGRRYRTLAVNAGTNFPELAADGLCLAIGQMGGIANPLGSNLANIYLVVLLIAPIWAQITGSSGGLGRLKTEFKLVRKHVMALGLWIFAVCHDAFIGVRWGQPAGVERRGESWQSVRLDSLDF